MTTHEVLAGAKGYLLNHGWTTHTIQAKDGRVCLVGALHCAQFGGTTHEDPTSWPAYVALSTMLHEPPACWNDADGRTFDDVIAALDRAILATAPVEAPEPVFA